MGLFGIAFPWETPAGEGFIAPWTPAVSTPSGIQSLAPGAPTFVNGQDLAAPAVQSIPASVPSGIDITINVPEQTAPVFNIPTAPVQQMQAAPVATYTNGASPGLTQVGLGSTAAALLPAAIEVAAEVLPSLLSNGTGGIPISGPGVPEPPKEMVAKQWVTLVHANDIGNYYVYFFKLIDGRIMCYNARLKEWKIWRPRKNLVISSNPRIKTLGKLNTLNKRVEKMLKPYQPKTRRAYPAKALASRYLSRAERQEIGVGQGIGGR